MNSAIGSVEHSLISSLIALDFFAVVSDIVVLIGGVLLVAVYSPLGSVT
jgi:hypothetical protein